MVPILSAAASFPVSTQTTPGAASAAAVSMLTIFCMGMGRHEHRAPSMTRQFDIGDVGACSAEEALILDTLDRLTDAKQFHRMSPQFQYSAIN